VAACRRSRRVPWTAHFGAPEVVLGIFQSEGNLIGIEALGTAAELRPLKLFDDRLKSVKLAVTVLDDGRHVTQRRTIIIICPPPGDVRPNHVGIGAFRCEHAAPVGR
jgi:hypothetical protein